MKPPIGPHSSPSQAQAQTPTPHTPDSQLILCAACGASSDKKVQFHRFFILAFFVLLTSRQDR